MATNPLTQSKAAYDKARANKKIYNALPKQIASRTAQNKARKAAVDSGRAKKWDGKQVDHKRPLDKGGSNSSSNTRVTSEKENKGWRKDHPGMYR